MHWYNDANITKQDNDPKIQNWTKLKLTQTRFTTKDCSDLNFQPKILFLSLRHFVEQLECILELYYLQDSDSISVFWGFKRTARVYRIWLPIQFNKFLEFNNIFSSMKNREYVFMLVVLIWMNVCSATLSPSGVNYEG